MKNYEVYDKFTYIDKKIKELREALVQNKVVLTDRIAEEISNYLQLNISQLLTDGLDKFKQDKE